jgi:7-carboxy-7-deazaguanine synthase
MVVVPELPAHRHSAIRWEPSEGSQPVPARGVRIAEIFRSRQGEGFLTGTESIFVRFSGCNLRCRFCDTPYASWRPEGEHLALPHLLAQIEGLAAKDDRAAVGHVVLTGGEPMLFAELVPLSQALRRAGWHITVETAGTCYLPVVCDLMSISPKLSNSTPSREDYPDWARIHDQRRHAPEVLRRLTAEHPYQIKFVIDSPAACDEAQRYLAEFPEIDRSRVMLMPEGTDPEVLGATARWLAPYCAERGLHFCPRRHIEWFGLVRGT